MAELKAASSASRINEVLWDVLKMAGALEIADPELCAFAKHGWPTGLPTKRRLGSLPERFRLVRQQRYRPAGIWRHTHPSGPPPDRPERGGVTRARAAAQMVPRSVESIRTRGDSVRC